MDGTTVGPEAAMRAAAVPGAARSVLFLQGPVSDFFDRLGRALIARGHRVHRINLHLGDRLFWRLPAVDFRGRFEDWRGFVGDYLDRHEITDLVLLGDRRPHHLVAAEEARARGIPVLATELGYVRPDWLTLEFEGMSSYSRFPRDPGAIRELADRMPPPDLSRRFRSPSFARLAVMDVAYNVAQVLGRPLYPFYRCHCIYHPYVEYAGWIVTLARHQLTRRTMVAAKVRLQNQPKSYFLFPLQLATDYQIRAHSPFVDARDAVRDVIASFAASGSRHKLVLIVHPLDNGLVAWARLGQRLGREYGVADRVQVLRDGTSLDLLRGAAGVVTINSTVGLTALIEGLPVKVLGNAVFDVPGLTCQDGLDRFWVDATRPDPDLLDAFLRALVGTTQIRGGYYEPESQAHAITEFIERLEGGLFPLPPLSAVELAGRKIRSSSLSVAIADAAGAMGRALARDYAAPGVSLLLAGGTERQIEALAEDCRRRGAEVTTCREGDDLAAALQAFDRSAPIDVLIAGNPTEPVAVAGRRMEHRRRGRIVLVSGLDRRHGAAALTRFKTLRAEANQLRRELGPGIRISVVRPSRIAGWLAERGAETIAEIGADRAARLIRRGCDRHAAEIAVPGPMTAMRKGLRFLPGFVGRWAKEAVLPVAPAVAPEPEKAPLPGESVGGN